MSRRSATSWPPGTTCSSRLRSKPTKPWVCCNTTWITKTSHCCLVSERTVTHRSCFICLRFLEQRFWMPSWTKLQERCRSVTSHWVRIKNKWRSAGQLSVLEKNLEVSLWVTLRFHRGVNMYWHPTTLDKINLICDNIPVSYNMGQFFHTRSSKIGVPLMIQWNLTEALVNHFSSVYQVACQVLGLKQDLKRYFRGFSFQILLKFKVLQWFCVRIHGSMKNFGAF